MASGRNTPINYPIPDGLNIDFDSIVNEFYERFKREKIPDTWIRRLYMREVKNLEAERCFKSLIKELDIQETLNKKYERSGRFTFRKIRNDEAENRLSSELTQLCIRLPLLPYGEIHNKFDSIAMPDMMSSNTAWDEVSDPSDALPKCRRAGPVGFSAIRKVIEIVRKHQSASQDGFPEGAANKPHECRIQKTAETLLKSGHVTACRLREAAETALKSLPGNAVRLPDRFSNNRHIYALIIWEAFKFQLKRQSQNPVLERTANEARLLYDYVKRTKPDVVISVDGIMHYKLSSEEIWSEVSDTSGTEDHSPVKSERILTARPVRLPERAANKPHVCSHCGEVHKIFPHSYRY